MTGFLSLPTELLQEVAVETTGKTLRLVCKQVNFALEPQILSRIRLSSIDLPSQLENLATAEPKPTPISKYATQLNICASLYPSWHESRILTSEEEAKIKSFLVPAVGSLTGVRKVSWFTYDSDPEWAILQVFDALASLPFLKDLYLRYRAILDPFFQLRRLPHLENLTLIRTSRLYNDPSAIIPVAKLIGWSQPKLTTLTIIHDPHDRSAPNLNDYLSETSMFLNITHFSLKGLSLKLDATVLPHLRSLISLTTEGIFSPQDQVSGNQGAGFSSGNIWSVLRIEKNPSAGDCHR